jgi:hypothetical protein
VAEFVVLKSWQSPPESGDRIVIVRDASTKTCMMTTWCGDRIIPHTEWLPLDHARKEAETFRIAAIYVRGVEVAKRP